MRTLFLAQSTILLLSIFIFSQDQNQDSLVSVLDHRWERVRIQGQKIDNRSASPQRMLTADDKYYHRASRENRPKSPFEAKAHLLLAGLQLHLDGEVRD